jgi:hypothetical protein
MSDEPDKPLWTPFRIVVAPFVFITGGICGVLFVRWLAHLFR